MVTVHTADDEGPPVRDTLEVGKVAFGAHEYQRTRILLLQHAECMVHCAKHEFRRFRVLVFAEREVSVGGVGLGRRLDLDGETMTAVLERIITRDIDAPGACLRQHENPPAEAPHERGDEIVRREAPADDHVRVDGGIE